MHERGNRRIVDIDCVIERSEINSIELLPFIGHVMAVWSTTNMSDGEKITVVNTSIYKQTVIKQHHQRRGYGENGP
jgi:hypothetical protein